MFNIPNTKVVLHVKPVDKFKAIKRIDKCIGEMETKQILSEKASEANPDIYFAKVDIDQNPDLASAAKVQAVPTLMVIKNQQIVFQQAGALRASDLDDLIAQAKELDVNAAAAEEATEQAQ